MSVAVSPVTGPKKSKKLQDSPYWKSWPARTALYGTVGITALLILLADLPLPAIGGLAALQMVALIFMNLHIGAAMGLSGAIALFAMRGEGVMAGALRSLPFGTAAVWTYTVIPMFVFMGFLLWRSGVTERIYDAAAKWLSWMPGGLAVGTNFAGAGMSAITGSTVATIVALGRIGLPEMFKKNYDPRLATGAVIIAGTGGQLIPPSIYMVIYAGLVSVPVGPQLMAGMMPGLLLHVLYAVMIIAMVMIWPHLVGKKRGERWSDENVTWGSRGRSLLRVWPLPALMVVMFGGMYGGIFTTTEAGAIGALCSLVLAYVYLRPKLATRAVGQSLKDTVSSTAGIFFLFFGAMIFNRALTVSGVSNVVTEFLGDLGLNAVTFMLAIILLYLVLGMILDPLTMMLVTVPLLIPTVEALGIDMILFGVFVVALGELAVTTPPVGMMVFILYKIAQAKDVSLGRRVTVGHVFMGAAWFIPISVLMLIAMIFWPEIAMWLPNLMMQR